MTRIVAQSPGTGGDDSRLGTVEPEVRPAETLRWSRFLAATTAEGPGIRSAVWLQGCAVHCPECFNPQLWADRGAVVADTTAVAAEWVARAVDAGAEGVTLLGGEPFDQAGAAASVALAFRQAGLGVMTFTGYPLARLTAWADAGRDDIAALLDATDLLCDGPYLRDLPDVRRPWVGSRNQGIRALTERHAPDVRGIDAAGGADRLEVRIDRDGTVAVNGWATDAALAALLADLGPRADSPAQVAAAAPSRTRTETAR